MRQLMHSFHGEKAPAAILDGVRNGQIASFCLFRGMNGYSPADFRTLTDSIHRAAREGGQPTPLIGIDQEGGQLIAVTDGATELPGNMALGATRSAVLAEKAGELLGHELLAMGITLNFAPSVDVNNNPASIGIGSRSFGDDPALVAELGAAQIRGMQKTGLMASAKHFPGLGDTTIDSHFDLPIAYHDMARLEAVELAPFRAAIAAGVGSVMTAHMIFTALDPEQPATLSAKVLGFLRGTLGFTGLTLTDAMDMHAVSQRGAWEALDAALRAGIDVAIMAHLPHQLDLMARFAGRENPASLARIQAAQRALPAELPPFEVIGSAAHRAIAQEIADRAITLVRGAENLPLRPAPDAQIAVITHLPANLTPADTSKDVQMGLAAAIAKRHRAVRNYDVQRDATQAEINAVLASVQGADYVVVGTITADKDESMSELVRVLHQAGKRPIVVALRTPYDLIAFPMVETYLCSYSIRPVAIEAVARALFGEIVPTGVLPCQIPGMVMG